jgi:hypothetical protein
MREVDEAMKKFYLCKLCLIVFGALLAVQSAIAESNNFYALASFSKGTGSQAEGYDNNRSWDSTREGNFSGIAVGYRFPVSDQLWGGIEFSHLTGKARSNYAGYSENWAEGITDLTGQLGVRSNAYFFYGSVSISRFEVVPRTKSLGNADLNTHGLGLGVEKMLADGYFIGVDYKSRFRDKSNYPNTLLGRKYWTENSIDTLGLRFGKHF